jgi:hypothetical protein
VNILQRIKAAFIKAELEHYLRKRGINPMASPIVESVIAFVTSVLSTGSGTLTLPTVTEDVAGYAVTEALTITATKK